MLSHPVLLNHIAEGRGRGANSEGKWTPGIPGCLLHRSLTGWHSQYGCLVSSLTHTEIVGGGSIGGIGDLGSVWRDRKTLASSSSLSLPGCEVAFGFATWSRQMCYYPCRLLHAVSVTNSVTSYVFKDLKSEPGMWQNQFYKTVLLPAHALSGMHVCTHRHTIKLSKIKKLNSWNRKVSIYSPQKAALLQHK